MKKKIYLFLIFVLFISFSKNDFIDEDEEDKEDYRIFLEWKKLHKKHKNLGESNKKIKKEYNEDDYDNDYYNKLESKNKKKYYSDEEYYEKRHSINMAREREEHLKRFKRNEGNERNVKKNKKIRRKNSELFYNRKDRNKPIIGLSSNINEKKYELEEKFEIVIWGEEQNFKSYWIDEFSKLAPQGNNYNQNFEEFALHVGLDFNDLKKQGINLNSEIVYTGFVQYHQNFQNLDFDFHVSDKFCAFIAVRNKQINFEKIKKTDL